MPLAIAAGSPRRGHFAPGCVPKIAIIDIADNRDRRPPAQPANPPGPSENFKAACGRPG